MNYYLHLPVPPELAKQVDAFKAKWQGQAGSGPHITLVIPTVSLPGYDEQALIANLTQAFRVLRPFPVKLLGPGFFNHKRVVHLQVERSVDFAQCQELAMQAIAGFLQLPTGEQANIPNPHLTLATRLSPQQGEEAWAEAQAQSWPEGFICQSIELLGKTPEQKGWQVVARFTLG